MSDKNATKLLVIDDDTHLRESLAEVLELDGFECHQAGTAKDGIDAAKKIGPRVLRAIVSVIGFGIAVIMFAKQLR